MNETKPIKSAKFVASYGQNESVTITYEDNSVCSVPFDNRNTDYQNYLAWGAAGNTAEAAD